MDPWVFLFEESLGNYIPDRFAELTGAQVKKHADAFPRGAPDQEWIPEAARNRWVIVSKDKKIRTRYLEVQALKASGARLFYLRYGDMDKEESAEAFVKAYPAMLSILNRTAPPFVARVSPSGRVEVENL